MTSKSIHPVLKDLASTPILGTGTELFRADEFPTKRAFAETFVLYLFASDLGSLRFLSKGFLLIISRKRDTDLLVKLDWQVLRYFELRVKAGKLHLLVNWIWWWSPSAINGNVIV
ncbi:hypothetical protein ACOSP7_007130 [Xanthoceras sorbifolium]